MTYNELRNHVASLGFEQTIEDEDALFRAAERALSLIFLDMGQLATARIYVSAPRLTKVYKKVKHAAGESEELTLLGTAFSFLPHGDGAYTLVDGEVPTRVEFVADGSFVKGAIRNGTATLRLEGEADYTLTSLASFLGKFSLLLDDVPEYSEFKLIPLASRLGDFRALAAPPRRPDGTPITEAEPIGAFLRLPFDFDGELVLDYYRAPRGIERGDALLDLPLGAEQLFPLLVASFLWLDDDAEKAQYYMALYRDGVSGLKLAARNESARKYVTNGWA